jgi:hypothetical protein
MPEVEGVVQRPNGSSGRVAVRAATTGPCFRAEVYMGRSNS